jgi:hypothetical protein
MPIIPPPFPPALPVGFFAFPPLPWGIAPGGLIPLTPSLRTFRAMFTTVQNQFPNVTDAYLPLVPAAPLLMPNDINILEAGLIADINAAILNWNAPPPLAPTNAQLTDIAVGIQLWGGNAGRGPFIRGGGFGNNFNVNAYRQIIAQLLILPAVPPVGVPYPVLQNAINVWRNNFNWFGVSFATKHFSFWSRANGMPTALPIYDNIMAKKFMGFLNATWTDYRPYVDGMALDAAAINLANPGFPRPFTIHDLERQLFVSVPAIAAMGWPR